MGRYQELFDFHFSRNINLQVLNMLNTKYVIFPNQQGKPALQLNPDANGPAWFVSELKSVNSADEEIKALDSLNTKKVAVVDASKFDLEYKSSIDSLATIKLLKNDVTSLTYESNSTSEQFVVFSEIYYKNGWNAYIDGKLTPHVRVNYVLRGMLIPSGKHNIEFKFEPTVIDNGNTITLTSYLLLIFIPIGWYFYDKKKK